MRVIVRKGCSLLIEYDFPKYQILRRYKRLALQSIRNHPLGEIPRRTESLVHHTVCRLWPSRLAFNVLRATTGALTSYVVRSPLYVQYAWMWQCSCSPSELQGVAVLSQLSPEKPSRQDPLRHTPPLPGRLSHTPWTQWHSENTHTLYKIANFSLNDIIVARFGFYKGCKHKRCNRLNSWHQQPVWCLSIHQTADAHGKPWVSWLYLFLSSLAQNTDLSGGRVAVFLLEACAAAIVMRAV